MKYLIIARNIVNQDDVEKFLKDCLEGVYLDEVDKWINKQLRDYIQKELETVKLFTKLEKNQPDWLQNSIKNKDAFEVYFKPRFKTEVKHILDYFMIGLENNERELSKISKLKFKAALAAANKWTQEMNKQAGEWDDFKGIEIVRKYKKGVKWVRVFSKQACEREGKVMDHCVGGYYKDVRDGLTSIYSLRDNTNKPHCTIEVRDGGVEQIKGYSDGTVEPQYQKYVLNFLVEPFKKKFKYFNELENAGLKEVNGKIEPYSFSNDRIIDGDLSTTDVLTPFKQDFLHVKGSVYLQNSKLNYLPNTLIVDDNIQLNNSSIVELPDNLTVNGTLFLNDSEILEIPENAKINGLNIADCKLKELPDNFTLNFLTIGNNVKLKKLPKNLTINRSLNLRFNDTITELPNNIKILGDIIFGKGIKKFPFKKARDLNLPDSIILPDNLVVESFSYSEMTDDPAPFPKNLVVKDEYIINTRQTTLPDNITIGSLEINWFRNSEFKKLPKNLTVNNLKISVPLEIPKDANISFLRLEDNEVVIPSNFTLEELELHNIKEKFTLPSNLTIDRLICYHCKLKELPENLIVNEKLDVTFNLTNVKLNDSLKVKKIVISPVQITWYKQFEKFKDKLFVQYRSNQIVPLKELEKELRV